MIHYSREHRDRIDVVDPVYKQHVSSLVWGNGPTSHTLFAGTGGPGLWFQGSHRRGVVTD